MQNLADHILADLSKPMGEKFSTDKLWEKVANELKLGADLESVLQNFNLPDSLTDHIIIKTWSFISTADFALFDKLIHNQKLLPLSRLYSHLFNSTNQTVSVVTTNYDRLAEYAADCAGVSHYTGFTQGYLRRKRTPVAPAPRSNRIAMNRTVDIWKVHGCLDWFFNDIKDVFAVTSANKIPKEFQPAIITPGIRKYEQALQEPFRSIMNEADTALSQASAYLCIGFGFNDKHIQSVLRQRWNQGDAILVILAKTLSASARTMLEQSNGNRFLSFEESNGGTQVRTHDDPDGFLLPSNHDLWSLESFLNHMI